MMQYALDGRTRRLALASIGVLVAFVCLALTAASARAQAAPEDKALGRPAEASSVEFAGDSAYGCPAYACVAGRATDGSPDTRWSSAYRNGESWTVDLGQPRLVDTVSIDWQHAYATRFRIGVSLDGARFATVAEPENNLTPAAKALLEVTQRFERRATFAVQSARYLRITGLARSTKWGISFWTVSVFGPPDAGPAPQPAPAPAPSVNPFASTGPAASPPTAPASPPKTPSPPSAPARRTAPEKLLAPFPVVRMVGTTSESGASIERFTVRAPRSALVRVRCTGGGCPSRDLTRRGPGRLRGVERRLRVGAVVQVFVTQKGRVGKYTRFVIRSGRAPRRVDSCARYGARRPTRCPALSRTRA